MGVPFHRLMHRIIGAWSATQRGGIYAGLDLLVGGSCKHDDTYGQEFAMNLWLEDISSSSTKQSKYRVIFFGEIHAMPQIVAFQHAILERIIRHQQLTTTKGTITSKLHIVMEHFSFEMQDMLNDYQRKKSISFDELVEKYHDIGTEGHDIKCYQPILESARNHPESVTIHAGFVSRTYARQLMTQGEDAALEAAAEWLPPNTTSLEGSEFHYNLFKSMISGQSIHNSHHGHDPHTSDHFQRIFKAQLLKDIAMAHKINTLLKECDGQDRFLIITGNGHVSYYQGVPERVLSQNPELVDHCCLITSHRWPHELLLFSQVPPLAILEEIGAGPPGANPADFLYVFADDS